MCVFEVIERRLAYERAVRDGCRGAEVSDEVKMKSSKWEHRPLFRTLGVSGAGLERPLADSSNATHH